MDLDNYTIVFNGEIYNYKDVKKELIDLGYTFNTESDTEVLLVGYKHWGKDILPKVNGMFAFSIYDSNTNKIFSARDRLGVKPFYYYWKDGEFEICSQIKPMLNSSRTINKDAISIYLDCDYIPTPFTIVNEINKLPPGNYFEIDLNTNTFIIEEYWNLSDVKTKDISYEDAKKELHLLLKDAVKIRLQSDVPIGSFLSGGIDSALVSSIASEMSKDKINTFCIGFDDPNFDESKVAEKFAQIIDSNHNTTICSANDILELVPKLVEVYDEPFADDSALPSLLLNRIAKSHVTVALSGDGGDESFLGYNHFNSLEKYKSITSLPFWLRKIISQPFILKILGQNSHRVKNALSTKNQNDLIENIFSRKGFILKEKKQLWMQHFQGYKKWSNTLLQKAADLNIKLWLESNSNVKVDRASMAYSVEVRSPFLDYRVIEYARSLPVSFRFHKGRQKRILRDILKEYIPEEIFDLPKSGFSIPLGKWMCNELKEEMHKALDDKFLNNVPNLNVTKFKKLFNDHMSGKEDYASYIWRLYVLSKWYEEFNFKND